MAEITFERFFRAVRGVDPFPWQSRLAALAAEGAWPDVIGVPTGLGKTAAIDAAVWALASQAGIPPEERAAPTRIWYVVNRRLLVDGAYAHGLRLASWLSNPDSARAEGVEDLEPIAWAGERLRSLAAFGEDFGPLHVTRLRGGADLGVRPPDASQPALIFATVPMYASRLLFRGYGSSASMRPIDAALAGIDSLVLLDEAHLARSLIKVVSQLEEADIGDPSRVIAATRARTRIVQLTATGEASGHVLDLTGDDLRHPVVQQRVNAAKRLKVLESNRARLTRDLALRVVELVDGSTESPAIAVMVNSPSTARSVLAELDRTFEGHHLEPELVMLTGLMREREAEAVRTRLLDPYEGVSAGHFAARRRPLIVIATQTLEVGADLDFDHLVTESCGIRAFVQRAGRVNRLGGRTGSTVTVVHPTDLKEDRLYEADRGLLWERLLAAGDGADLSPLRINDLVGSPQDQAPRSGEILPHHVWEWAKTTGAWSRGAPPEFFYDGLEPVRSVSVVWRFWIPSTDEPVRELFPPVTGSEAVEIPLWELRSAFEKDALVDRLDPSMTLLERVAIGDVKPGDVVVLPAETGGYDSHGWNPASDSPVPDFSLFVAGLPIEEAVVRRVLCDGEQLPDVWQRLEELARAVVEAEGDDEAPAGDFAAALADMLRQSRPPSWVDADEYAAWGKWVEGLSAPSAWQRLHKRAGTVFLSLPSASGLARRDEADELSMAVEPVGLFEHLTEVGDFASRIARAVGVASGLIDSLADAGRLHDIGKADPRFQRWLDPSGAANQLLAKSNAPLAVWEAHRRRAGWPRGGRHELISAGIARHLCSSRSDLDLVVHLVASHHGQGRPFVSVVEGAESVPFSVDCWGIRVEVSSFLSEPDLDQPARFRSLCEEFGYWGLALLEAVVRQADHIASRRARVA